MRISVQSEQVDKIVCGSKIKLLFFVTEMMQNMIVISYSCTLKS